MKKLLLFTFLTLLPFTASAVIVDGCKMVASTIAVDFNKDFLRKNKKEYRRSSEVVAGTYKDRVALMQFMGCKSIDLSKIMDDLADKEEKLIEGTIESIEDGKESLY